MWHAVGGQSWFGGMMPNTKWSYWYYPKVNVFPLHTMQQQFANSYFFFFLSF